MISKKDVEYIARLAHLEIDEQDKEVFTNQLGAILDYIDQLSQLETEGVEATAYTVPMKNVFREDRIATSISREKALANAPDQREGQFRVPPIIG
ncbi:MAG: Asp-tRNA(Asn)/Glu-tRNA(Gln) amidotransferase subunit GatC [Halanaerobiales bacterium]|nr:Asp-tRNA(Asn)/Glu-tRNA(Gln) amidotransferase subunit GatC [Halanaerobiales bacterium]